MAETKAISPSGPYQKTGGQPCTIQKNVHARVIVDSDTGPVEKDSTEEAFAEHSSGDDKRVKTAVTEAIPDINGIQMLKEFWVMQQRRVSGTLELEYGLGIRIGVTAHKDVQLLTKIAAAIMNHETKSAGTKWKAAGELTPPEVEKPGPLAQKVPIDSIDRDLRRRAASSVIAMVRENAAMADGKRSFNLASTQRHRSR
jgi:hypothetical protein